ncbi:MAG: S46 family peptidase [Bacteroidetes bacterium]|nr:S46 family peptidase [Bacteroidota bacterium]
MKKSTFVILLVFGFILQLHAQEGMWLLSQINQLDLSKKGLQVAVSDVYSKDKPSISDAIVQLGGGTASFVSADGLLITNHHVAFGALQRASSVSSDYLINGFLATKRSDEIKAPGYRARLLTDMRDVTMEVLEAAKGLTDPTEKSKKINEKIAKMTDAIKGDKKDIDASVAQMYNGKQYILFVHKVFKDIRIVYAPPSSIGNYGGETDNWMWPRHTGDFSFLRVYCAPDGTGKEYASDNVPYHPKVWLKIAKDFLKDGDFNFIIGYPGQTTRYRSSTSVYWNEHYNYPFSIKNFQEIIDLCDQLTKDNHEGQLKVANLKKGLANVMKNYQGKVDGMKKTHFYEKKLEFEKEFVKWANSKPESKTKYADILEKEKAEYTVLETTRERDNVFGIFQGLAGTPLTVAQQIIFFAQERDKPESERDPGFNEERVNQTIEGLEYTYANYFEPVDKALMIRVLKLAKNLPQNQRITGLDYVFNNNSKSIEQFTDETFKSSKLLDLNFTKTLFKKSTKELQALNDPFINLAYSIDPMAIDIQKTTQRFGNNVTELRKVYLDGLYEWKGTGMYPDANGTKRFTWGKVKGYRPADAVWYYPFTSLEGVVEKNTGIEPFDAPAKLVDLYNKKDFGRWENPAMKDVPVAWLNQCDITGGNSGSPVLNAKGEICGVAFDGNYESMISDWQYDYSLQRCINVDIHYVLFITEKVGKAGFLLDEMGVGK